MNDSCTFQVGSRAGSIHEVLALSAPLMVSHMSHSAMWVIDTLVLGRVGTIEQGAAGLGGVLVWALMCFFAGTMTATNILVAQSYGAQQRDLAKHVRTAWVLVAPMALVIIGFWPLVGAGLSLLRVSEAVVPHAQTYVQIRLLSAPFVLTSFMLTCYLRGLGNMLTPMVVALAANVFNAVATVALVFGYAGLPAMGVAGAAIGTVAGAVFECALYLGVYLFSPTSRAHGSRVLKLPRAQEVRSFLAIGTSIGLTNLFETVTWASFSVYAGSRPPVELAAHTILFQISGLCFMPAIAVGIAASTLVGQYTGAQRLTLAKKSAWSALQVGVGYMAGVGVLLALVRRPLMSVFSTDADVVLLGSTLTLIAAMYQPFDGLGIVSQGVLRGAGRTTAPTMVMLGSGFLVFIPTVWFLGEHHGLGIVGAWLAALVHVIVVGVVLAVVIRLTIDRPRTLVPTQSEASG